MAVVRCKEGHFYDGARFGECPHCKNPPAQRRPLGDALTEYRPGASQSLGGRVEIQLGSPAPGGEKTVGIFKSALGRDPVVGWLVCVSGTEAGRDYRLHAGRNLVGRALKMDVCLPDDERVTREDHCSIVFEPKKCVFVLARGLGDGVLANGRRLEDSLVLTGGERLEIGASAFIFIPFCMEGRTW